MNSKIILLLMSLVVISCGVKTRPVAPISDSLPQLEKKYQKKYSLKLSKKKAPKK